MKIKNTEMTTTEANRNLRLGLRQAQKGERINGIPSLLY